MASLTVITIVLVLMIINVMTAGAVSDFGLNTYESLMSIWPSPRPTAYPTPELVHCFIDGIEVYANSESDCEELSKKTNPTPIVEQGSRIIMPPPQINMPHYTNCTNSLGGGVNCWTY